MKSTITMGFAAGAALMFTVLSAQDIHAQSVSWGSAVGSVLQDSNGDSLGSDFRFELGTFSAGFNPAENSSSLWAADWHGFDMATTENEGFASTFGFFTKSAAIDENGHTTSNAFAPAVEDFDFRSSKLYIWAYRDNKSVDGGNEFALITDTDWKLPATVNPTGTPLSFRLADSNSAVLGDSQNAAFSLRTAAVGGAVIPEPGTAFLAVIGLSGLLFRRRRAS
ncbi:MAG: hypothetical protein ACI9R3_000492 [Verrucomicrobiales bacterium]|jgi:hypothetical protein